MPAKWRPSFHEVLGQSLNNVAELNGLLLSAGPKDVVFIDECHEMKREHQTALYLALDKQCVFVKGGNSTPQGIPINNFSLLLATTDEFCILQPLRDRMKLMLRYEFYSEAELVQILQSSQPGFGLDHRGGSAARNRPAVTRNAPFGTAPVAILPPGLPLIG